MTCSEIIISDYLCLYKSQSSNLNPINMKNLGLEPQLGLCQDKLLGK